MPTGVYPRKKVSPLVRFRKKWKLSTKHAYDGEPCWEWQGSMIGETGYGKFSIGGPKSTFRAHRFSYEHFRGPISQGLELDHLCRVRHCVNPTHLEAVTHQENQRRWKNIHDSCPKGHIYDIANSYINPKGYRKCRDCHRDAGRRYRFRKKEVT